MMRCKMLDKWFDAQSKRLDEEEKIQQEDGYNLPLSTLTTMCFNHGIKLSDFFKIVESKYSKFLTDDYFFKIN